MLHKRRLVGRFQAAQVQPQGIFPDAANDGAGQLAQRGFQPLQLAAGVLALRWRNAQAVAGQRLDWQGAAANLAAEGCRGDRKGPAYGALQQRRQCFGLCLHVGRRAGEQAQCGQALAQLVG